MTSYIDTSEPGLSENVGYLSDSNLLALLEMGLARVLLMLAVDPDAVVTIRAQAGASVGLSSSSSLSLLLPPPLEL